MVLTLTRAPKMLLMAAVDGSGTLKMANWRLSRLGMSFLPPPGWFMAATYLRRVQHSQPNGIERVLLQQSHLQVMP